MIAPVLTIASILAGFYLVFYVFFPLGRGAIYFPSTPEKTLLFVTLLRVLPGERAADLGAGDGRVVIALAQSGAEAHGFEINPALVLIAKRNIRRAGLRGRAFIHWRSFWRADLSRFDVLTVFQGSFIMKRLEAKVRRELSPGARIVSDYWGFPTMAPESLHDTVVCYRIPDAPSATGRG